MLACACAYLPQRNPHPACQSIMRETHFPAPFHSAHPILRERQQAASSGHLTPPPLSALCPFLFFHHATGPAHRCTRVDTAFRARASAVPALTLCPARGCSCKQTAWPPASTSTALSALHTPIPPRHYHSSRPQNSCASLVVRLVGLVLCGWVPSPCTPSTPLPKPTPVRLLFPSRAAYPTCVALHACLKSRHARRHTRTDRRYILLPDLLVLAFQPVIEFELQRHSLTCLCAHVCPQPALPPLCFPAC